MRDKNEVDTTKYPQYDPNYHAWDAFEKHADEEGIGDDVGDWWSVWVDWCCGYNAAWNEGPSGNKYGRKISKYKGKPTMTEEQVSKVMKELEEMMNNG